MPAVFTGRWTRGTILDQALQRAGNAKIRQLARDRLNRVLEELYTQWEWPFLYKATSFTFPASNTGGQIGLYASVALPSDFLKTEHETTGLRVVQVDGNVRSTPVVELDPIAFRRRAIPYDQEGQRPLVFYVSYGEQIMYFWPRPTSACVAEFVYKFLPPDVAIGTGSDPVTTAYDADIPLFPWGGYLAMEIECWALQYDRDPRAGDTRAEANAAFDNIRNIAMPRGSQEDTIPLDSKTFGRAFRDESTRYYSTFDKDDDWW